MTEADIEIIIVTAFVNVLVTGIVASLIFYRYQKNIDFSIGKKLEEFKAELQLSNFREQTIFTGIYEKRVETLQTLFRKLSTYCEDFNQLIQKCQDYLNSFSQENITMFDCEDALEKLVDFRIFFGENRIFLTDDINNRILGIYRSLNYLYDTVTDYLPDGRYRTNSFDLMKSDFSQNEKYTSKYSKEGWEAVWYADLLGMIRSTVAEQLGEMEDIYRTVAEARNNKI